MKTVVVSIGDLNGIGFEIALRSHHIAKKLANIKYCVSLEMALKACKKLDLMLPDDFECVMSEETFEIKAGKATKEAGEHSFASFKFALDQVVAKKADAVVTLPINKEAWMMADLPYKGHTDYLKERFGEAIMMLGCDALFVMLYSDHIALKDVPKMIEFEKMSQFLVRLARSVDFEKMSVLGLNPHAGDGGAIGHEERIIKSAIDNANRLLGSERFAGPVVPDTAFTPASLAKNNRIVALYHDQGLAPLKALYFEESINVSLALPIVRTSVDHGTAFDKAYKGQNPSIKSYLNAIKYAIKERE